MSTGAMRRNAGVGGLGKRGPSPLIPVPFDPSSPFDPFIREFIHLVRVGDRMFVTYEASGAGGHRFRNIEIGTVHGLQIVEVEVYTS